MSIISDAIKKQKGGEQDIINAGRDDLPAFFRELGLKVGVEIGVAKGKYTEILARGGLSVFGVDPYKAYPGYDGPGMQERLDAEYDEARDRLDGLEASIIRKTSVEASQGFEDGSLDFVYIDGHHDFKFFVDDLYHWIPKVRKGGVISGHDFVYTLRDNPAYNCHVKQVVRAWTSAYRIRDWYVLGRYHFPTDPNEIRDQWRSWFWIKQ